MIILGILVVSAILFFAIWIPPRVGGPRLYRVTAVVPMLLTVVLPVPFVLAEGGPSDWSRRTVLVMSRVGIGLSAVFLIIGVILTVRAAMSDKKGSVSLLILETALAGLPAVLLTVSAIVLR